MPERARAVPKHRSREIDQERIRKAVAEIIVAIGEDPQREGLRETPRRMAAMYAELFAGLALDPMELLSHGFLEDYGEVVILRDIPFHSLCEHHFLPFLGLAHIGYIPNGRIIGISKLARLVDTLARRPQVQERLTGQIADYIMAALEPDGEAVVLEAEHLCTSIRGVKKPGSRVVTSALRGDFGRGAMSGAELLTMVRGR